jgi:tripeptidyl-peptidase-1
LNAWLQGPSWTGRGYYPSFPATSPYVTAVGATQGPESGNPEIACQSQEGGVITTGGGFSTFYATPDWQQAAVNAYFNGLTPDERPAPGYNPNGRGYPDISYLGVNYKIVVSGSVSTLYGTSASAPLFAAMISLINAERIKANKTTVGFLNPTLYAYGLPNTFGPGNTNFNPYQDVLSGDNRCLSNGDPSDAVCCESGFDTDPGWDPVTGWGTAKFPDLARMMDVQVNYTLGSGGGGDNNGNGISALSLVVTIVIIIAAVLVGCAICSCLVSMCCSPFTSSHPPLSTV